MDLSKVVVFVGELGDSDYEGSFGGMHKNVILKGHGVGDTIHTNCRNYPLHHVLPTNDPKTVECQKSDVDGIKATLAKLSLLKP